jgi:hypothetical protein
MRGQVNESCGVAGVRVGRLAMTERSTHMDIKYIGIDVDKETISIAVMNGNGKPAMESMIETKASTELSAHVKLFRFGIRIHARISLTKPTQ